MEFGRKADRLTARQEWRASASAASHIKDAGCLELVDSRLSSSPGRGTFRTFDRNMSNGSSCQKPTLKRSPDGIPNGQNQGRQRNGGF
jgi:hypothetical protein